MEEQDLNIINNATKIERYKKFFSNNLKKIITFVLLIIILVFSYFLYLDVRKKKINKISDNYNNLTINFNKNNMKETNEGLTKIIYTKDSAYSPLALYFLIDNNIEKDGDTLFLRIFFD